MRNTYHTLPEDTALFDRLRHRAYAYTKGYALHIVGVYVRPSFGSELYATSDEITFWDVTVVYVHDDYSKEYVNVHKTLTRSKMERLYRSTDRATRYYAGGVA